MRVRKGTGRRCLMCRRVVHQDCGEDVAGLYLCLSCLADERPEDQKTADFCPLIGI